MAKEKLPKFNTPLGVLKFPWIQTPSTKFNPDGTYQTSLLLTEEQAAPLIEKLNALTDEWFNTTYNEAKKKDKEKITKKYPYAEEVYEDEDEEEVATGLIEFKFKQNAQVTSKKTGKVHEFHVGVFDKFNKPIPNEKVVYGGSTAIINFSPRPYYMPSTGDCGITLQLNAVQVHSFGVGGSSASTYGFEASEDDPTDEAFNSVENSSEDGDY